MWCPRGDSWALPSRESVPPPRSRNTAGVHAWGTRLARGPVLATPWLCDLGESHIPSLTPASAFAEDINTLLTECQT